jgi:hypothetical protein
MGGGGRCQRPCVGTMPVSLKTLLSTGPGERGGCQEPGRWIAGTPESRRKSRSSNERRRAIRCTDLTRQPTTSRVRPRAERMRGPRKQGTHIASGVLRGRRVARGSSSCSPRGRLRRGVAAIRHGPSCATSSRTASCWGARLQQGACHQVLCVLCHKKLLDQSFFVLKRKSMPLFKYTY